MSAGSRWHSISTGRISGLSKGLVVALPLRWLWTQNLLHTEKLCLVIARVRRVRHNWGLMVVPVRDIRRLSEGWHLILRSDLLSGGTSNATTTANMSDHGDFLRPSRVIWLHCLYILVRWLLCELFYQLANLGNLRWIPMGVLIQLGKLIGKSLHRISGLILVLLLQFFESLLTMVWIICFVCHRRDRPVQSVAFSPKWRWLALSQVRCVIANRLAGQVFGNSIQMWLLLSIIDMVSGDVREGSPGSDSHGRETLALQLAVIWRLVNIHHIRPRLLFHTPGLDTFIWMWLEVPQISSPALSSAI